MSIKNKIQKLQQIFDKLPSKKIKQQILKLKLKK
jgi:hypothetical protein